MLYNATDSTYWDGGSWVATEIWLDAWGTASWSYDASSITFAEGKTFHIRAKSIDKAGNESLLASSIFSYDITAPAAPKLLSPAEAAAIRDVPELSWSEVNDPSGVTYSLQVDSYSEPSRRVIDEVGLIDNFYIPSSPLPEGTYYWRVKAIDGAGNESGWSSVGSFTIKPKAVTYWGMTIEGWAAFLGVILLLAGALVLRRRLSGG
jgi:predicted phage tail protein